MRPVADEELAAISRGEGAAKKGARADRDCFSPRGRGTRSFATRRRRRRGGRGLGIPGVPAPETAIVPGAGHAAHVEAPEALVVALVKFMEGR